MKSLKYIAILLVIFAAELAATVLPPTSRGAYSSGRRLIGQTITFTGSGSFDNDSQTGEYGPIWLWDFEYDGTNFSGDIQTGSMTATHVYNTPGVYKVGVQYRDDDEQWGSVYTFTITINRIDRYYYVKDHLGSVRQTVNGSGAIVAAQDYYPYGELLRSYNNSLANEKYKFTEKERDVETGFDYSISRYYDNKLGIWLQADPLSNLYPGESPYSYTSCNPINRVDPTGTDWYSETDKDGNVTYHWDEDLNSDNAGDRLGKGQAYVGVNQFVNGANGYEFLGSTESSRYAAWKDGWGFSYYQDNYGIINMYATPEMVLDNLKTAFLTAAGEALSLFKFGSSAAKSGTSLWPAAGEGRKVINGIEYTSHALERMQPVGTIFDKGVSYSRGVTPKVVENVIKFGKVTPGNTAGTVERTFENVHVITNTEGTRVITLWRTGR